MTTSLDINTSIKTVAAEFTRQLALLRTRAGRTDTFDEDKLVLSVTVRREKVSFDLSYACGYGNNVRGATLAELMREVARRAGFDDKQEGEMQAAGEALRALPGPGVSGASVTSEPARGFLADQPLRTVDDIPF